MKFAITYSNGEVFQHFGQTREFKVFDSETNQIFNYYYWRGKGTLNCRVADADFIFDKPDQWADPVTVATGSQCPFDAGNVNATVLGSDHILAWYSGEFPHTEILISSVPQTTFQ